MKYVIISTIFICLCFFCTPANAEDKIVICNVGQGDGIFIHLDPLTDILIDAGPDSSILQCLSRHMSFFDNTIELAILTNADKDHYYGYIPTLKKYKLETMILPELENPNKEYIELQTILKQKNIRKLTNESNDRLQIGRGIIEFIFPSKEDITKCLPNDRNSCSYVFYFTAGNVTALFTGDSSPETFTSLRAQILRHVDILKIPHHGSKVGLTADFFKKINPDLNVVSLGEGNPYGHPHQQLLTILENAKLLRTDKHGNIILKLPKI